MRKFKALTFSAYTKEFRYNLSLAWPVVLGMLGHTITGIVDNIMVGKIGTAELAAASLGNSMVFIAMSAGIGFSTAITPIVAQYDAEKNLPMARTVFHHGLLLCTVIGILLFGAVWFAKPLMYLMGQPEEVVTLAAPYVDWVAFSLFPMIIFQGYKQFTDGLSLTKYAMYAVVISNIINIVVNYLLIYGVWIFPEMGLTGAAIGTVAARVFMVVYMHYIMARNEKLKAYISHFSFAEIRKSIIKRISAQGLPSAMQMLFEVALFTAAVWLSGAIGKASQAANQIALSLASLTFMFAIGLSVTAMIRVGNQKGLKDYRKLLLVARSVFLMAVMLEVVFALLFVVFHNYLPPLFLNMHDAALVDENELVISIAAQLLLVAAIFQISDGIQVVVLGALRGLQDVKIPTVITFVSYWVIGFPVSYYLGHYTKLEATGIWIGLLAGLTAAALFLYLRFNYLTRKLISQG